MPFEGPGWLNELGTNVVGLPNNSYKSITNTARVDARLCKLQKRCTRLAATSDKIYQLLAHGRWFSPGTPTSSTTKTGRHDIAEILLKVALKHQKSKSNHMPFVWLKSIFTENLDIPLSSKVITIEKRHMFVKIIKCIFAFRETSQNVSRHKTCFCQNEQIIVRHLQSKRPPRYNGQA